MRDERLPRRFLNDLHDMLKGNGEETGLGWTASAREQCCNSQLCQESGSWEARSRKRRAWASWEQQCSLDLNLPWITARLGSQLHPWRFCLGCVAPSGNAESATRCRRFLWLQRQSMRQGGLGPFAAGVSTKRRAAASALIDLATIHENVGHDHLLQEGHALRFDSASSHAGVFHTKDGGRRGGLSAVRCTGAVAPHQRPNFCWQPNAVEDISGRTAVCPMMVS